jgi:hypothetical protein
VRWCKLRKLPKPTTLPASKRVSLKPFEGVISKQKGQRADKRREKTDEVEAGYAGGSESMVEPASGKSADDSHQDVRQTALSIPFYKPAAYHPRSQTEKYPRHR